MCIECQFLQVREIIASIVISVCFLTNPITHLNDELSVFIDGQISEHNYTESDDSVFVVLSHKILDVDKSINKTTVYMWALYTEYSYENGVEIAVINVLSNEDVLQKTYFDVINDIGRNWAII